MSVQTELFTGETFAAPKSPSRSKTVAVSAPAVAVPEPRWLSSPTANLPVFSIRQPWAWLILHGGKDIENRRWRTHFRGRFLIHAAKGCTEDEYEDGGLFAEGATDGRVVLPSMESLQRGGVVGVAEIVDCVNRSGSPWFVGPWGFVLRNVQPLDFWPCRGALSFFRLTH